MADGTADIRSHFRLLMEGQGAAKEPPKGVIKQAFDSVFRNRHQEARCLRTFQLSVSVTYFQYEQSPTISGSPFVSMRSI